MANERSYTTRNVGREEKPVWERWFAITVADAVLMSDKEGEEKNIVDFIVEYVSGKIDELVGGASGAYDTLKEIEDYIREHEDVAAAINAAIDSKLSKTETAAAAERWETERNINGLMIDGSSDATNYAICATPAEVAEKTVECTNFELVAGAEITVKFTVTNTAESPSLNVGGTGAKPLYYRGVAIAAGYLAENRTYTFRYNGEQLELTGDINTDTTYSDMRGATASAAGKHGLVPAPAEGQENAFLRSDGTWVTPSTSLAGNVPGIPADQTALKALKEQLDSQNSNLSELSGKLKVNYTQARSDDVFYDTNFTKLANCMCVFSINVYLSANRPQNNTEIHICTLDYKPENVKYFSLVGVLDDNLTIIPVQIRISADGKVYAMGSWANAALHLTYIRGYGTFLS